MFIASQMIQAVCRARPVSGSGLPEGGLCALGYLANRIGGREMLRRLLVWPCLCLSGLQAGCASAPKDPATVPVAWSQGSEEIGILPVGRVVSIERVSRPAKKRESNLSQVAREAAAAYLVLPLALVTLPVTLPVLLAADAAGVDFEEKTPTKDGNVFRHVIRLRGDGEEVIRDEYFSYQVGDCVALRPKPVLLVPAFPDQCN